jgi:hypothetical protein
MKTRRRDFLKTTAVGATGWALSRAKPARAAWPSSGTMQINPNIDNLRVVACVDPAMAKGGKLSGTSVSAQDAQIDSARVQANMDAMAMALAQKCTPDEAWKTIFRSGKDWASTVVALKVNPGSAQVTTHLAVLRKFSSLFTGWGVKPQNFILFDMNSNAYTMFNSFFSTTDQSKILGVVSAPAGQANDLMGGYKDSQLVDGQAWQVAGKLADGTVDILIDLGNSKGHTALGGATMCMKNHYGTFKPNTSHPDLDNNIFKMNKSDAIIGGDPVRQQLCFIDTIVDNNTDTFSPPTKQPNYLVMGTFAPAVDYLTLKKVREGVNGYTHQAAAVDKYMTSFGYKTSDPQWIVVAPDAGPPDGCSSGAGGASGTGGGDAGGVSGAGGSSTSGSSGTGGAQNGGSNGSGGTSASGGARTSGRGGANAGGSQGSGGAQSGGSQGSGGASASGGTGAGGSSGTGGMASGGVEGSGGAGSGGAVGSGGTTSPGGTTTSSSTSGTGGAAPSGGAAPAGNGTQGCACEVGDIGTHGLGAGLVLGTLVAGGLHRLWGRRDAVAQSGADGGDKATADASSSPAAPEGDEPDST